MLFSTFISGILLCAKTKLAKTKLAAYFAEGTSLVGSGWVQTWSLVYFLTQLILEKILSITYWILDLNSSFLQQPGSRVWNRKKTIKDISSTSRWYSWRRRGKAIFIICAEN